MKRLNRTLERSVLALKNRASRSANKTRLIRRFMHHCGKRGAIKRDSNRDSNREVRISIKIERSTQHNWSWLMIGQITKCKVKPDRNAASSQFSECNSQWSRLSRLSWLASSRTYQCRTRKTLKCFRGVESGGTPCLPAVGKLRCWMRINSN